MKTKAILLLSLLTQISAFGTTLFDDTFANGSSQWYSGGAAANTYVTNNDALAITGLTGSNLGGQGVVTSFESPGTELSLAVGETMTLSFSYYYTGSSSSDFGLGFGFYDTGSNRLTTSGTGLNSSLFNAWTGYSAFGVFGQDTSGAGRFHIADRVTTANNLLSPYTTGVLGTTKQTDGLLSDTWYGASLSLTYLSSSNMLLTATIGSETFSVLTTPTVTNFDSLAITSGAQPIGTLEIANVSVTESTIGVAPVPEPSTWAMGGFGIVWLGLVCWHRHRKSIGKS